VSAERRGGEGSGDRRAANEPSRAGKGNTRRACGKNQREYTPPGMHGDWETAKKSATGKQRSLAIPKGKALGGGPGKKKEEKITPLGCLVAKEAC